MEWRSTNCVQYIGKLSLRNTGNRRVIIISIIMEDDECKLARKNVALELDLRTLLPELVLITRILP